MSDKIKYTDLLRNKLLQQKEVYEDFKNNKCSSVRYKSYKHEIYGTQDENYTNRLRLVYYLFYENIDDEKVIAELFEEELKDRETNSFQGIGSNLEFLTRLLRKYNSDGKYTPLFKRAKNANFDCYCGYSFEENISDELYRKIADEFYRESNIQNNNILKCIYIAQETDYKDVMSELVDLWKETVTDWDNNRKTLIGFNSFLGREKDNEEIYKQFLALADKEKVFDVTSAYSGIIGYYIGSKDYKNAYKYLTELLNEYNLDEIKKFRLYDDILEHGLVIAANAPEFGKELWSWAKPELKSKKDGLYGNLYEKSIAAAKAVDDPYSRQLEKDYIAWKKKVGI